MINKNYTLHKKILRASVGITGLLIFSSIMISNLVVYRCMQKAGIR